MNNPKPIEYLATIEHRIEPIKRVFYQSIVEKKIINSGRLKATLSEYAWHPNVFLPNHIWREILHPIFLQSLYEQEIKIQSKKAFRVDAYFANLLTVFTWRYSKSIYRFDSYTFDSLSKHSAGKFLDHKLLVGLPEGCAYIELATPLVINQQNVYGIYATLDFSDSNLNLIKNKLPNQLIVCLDTHNPFTSESFENIDPMPTIVFNIERSGKITQQISFLWNIQHESKDELNDILSPVISLISAL
ncbi:hypothetical protein OHW85_21970, partial [Acinetobacter baumannii]|nr:hypothetical protein [Acinetobacter baumannii]